MADDKDNKDKGNEKDKEKKTNIIPFPKKEENSGNGEEFLSGLLNALFGTNVNTPRKDEVIIKEPDPNQDLKEVLENLTNEEIFRIQKNLYFLDFLEDELRLQVQERALNGTLDLKTLQEVIATMNKSVDRSSKILRDKDSELVQILIDNRGQTINNVNTNEESEGIVDKRSRKKLQRLMNVLLSESKSDNIVIDAEIIENDNENEDD